MCEWALIILDIICCDICLPSTHMVLLNHSLNTVLGPGSVVELSSFVICLQGEKTVLSIQSFLRCNVND